ncbi:haloacid dehalogenase [Sorangium cellulosum]|uniref:phosphoglycolate phosphatase n=1 Tax=Sorangium cellulosum TaxID=56 RepID=A0A4P2Q537_SORCE|nr:HAD family phosphatase [Sorangium cellulosum]AUX24517.1 haloacid dehalogenase [Sorangium cellulosum]
MFKAILWDNDGVLVDTEGLYFQATREALASVGVELTVEDYRRLFLVESRGAWHLASARGVDEAGLRSLAGARDRRYLELIARGDTLLPDARHVVSTLAARFRMAIVTSSQPEPFHRAHAATGLLRWFEFALTREQYARAKPDPEPYRVACARLGLAARDVLVIEDSERGLRSAKAAGLSCWVVPSPLTASSDFTGADETLASLREVLARLSGAWS